MCNIAAASQPRRLGQVSASRAIPDVVALQSNSQGNTAQGELTWAGASWRPLTTQALRPDPLRCACRAALRHCVHSDRSRTSRLRLAAQPGQFACDRASRLATARQLHPCRTSLFVGRRGPQAVRSAAHWTPRRPGARRRSRRRAGRLGSVRHRLRRRPSARGPWCEESGAGPGPVNSRGAAAQPLRAPGLRGHPHRRPGQRGHRRAERGLPLGLLLRRIEHGDGGQPDAVRCCDQRSVPPPRQKRDPPAHLARNRARLAEQFVASRPASRQLVAARSGQKYSWAPAMM
jgi:hypothetical protein